MQPVEQHVVEPVHLETPLQAQVELPPCLMHTSPTPHVPAPQTQRCRAASQETPVSVASVKHCAAVLQPHSPEKHVNLDETPPWALHE